MVSSSASTWISIKLIHHYHIMRLITSSQHETGTSSQHEVGTSSQHEVGTSSQQLTHHHSWHIITTIKHEVGTSSQQLSWHIITTIKLAYHHINYAGTSSQQLRCRIRLYQAYLKIAQNLHEIEAWSTHQQPVHLC
jgi:hypothetical protein